MEDPRPAGLPSLDDLAAEIMALRQRLNNLERQMQLLGGRPAVALPERPAAALSSTGPGTPDVPGTAGTTPFAQVLTADDDTAMRHLEQLRAAIVRLREERAQAAAEFRNLTRPLEAPRDAASPGRGPAATPTGSAVVGPAIPEPAALDVPPATTPVVVTVASDDAALSALPMETATIAPRVTDAPASHVRMDVDDVPELPGPVEVGDEAWREVRQAVLQTEAWREPEAPRRRWRPVALACAGAAALVIAAYALWPARTVPAGTEAANTVGEMPLVPATSPPEQRSAQEPAATPTLEGAAGLASTQGAPIGTSGTDAVPVGSTTETPAASTSPPAPAPAPVAEARIEIRTTREVWMRTTVDGDPPVERLVPGGRTLRFSPAHVLLLRAGDAGGLRVVVDGQDRGVLGADGQVVNRRYELSPKKNEP